MMFRSFLVIFLLSLVLSAPANAARAKLGIGVTETLTYVAPISTAVGASAAYCKRQRQHYAFGYANIWATSDYVMSARSCEGAGFTPLPATALASAIRRGLLPDSAKPLVSFQDRMMQSGGLLVLALVMIVISLRGLIRGKLNGHSTTENFPKAHQKLIIAMATAANTDSDLVDGELETIHEMVNRLSYREYSRAEVRNLILATEPAKTDGQIRKLGKGLMNSQKLAIFKAAHAVCGADSSQCSTEDGFLSRLAKGLKLPSPDIQAVLSR